ncbi:hypothetical protein GCM10020229_22950 [Kitasatospora albolonga]
MKPSSTTTGPARVRASPTDPGATPCGPMHSPTASGRSTRGPPEAPPPPFELPPRTRKTPRATPTPLDRAVDAATRGTAGARSRRGRTLTADQAATHPITRKQFG